MSRPHPRPQISHHCSSAYPRQAPVYPQRGVPVPRQVRQHPAVANTRQPRLASVATAPVKSPQPSTVRRHRQGQRQPRSRQVWLAGSGMIALAALVVVPKTGGEVAKPVSNVCEMKVASQSVLSRDELSQLLAVSEGSPKDTVQTLVSDPYCTLAPIALREGAMAERAAYPLEFDPQTWFIVLYEDNQYAGFDFSFSRD